MRALPVHDLKPAPVLYRQIIFAGKIVSLAVGAVNVLRNLVLGGSPLPLHQ
jgi:hypothetical protein